MPEKHITLRWSAFEHEHIERGSDWFWALGIVAVCTAVVALLFHDFLFSIVILIGAFTIGLLAVHPPEEIEFELSDKGVRVGSKLHRFHEIIAFWVEDEHHTDRPLLLVDTVKIMSPNLIIPIEHIDPREVRAYLKERCKEMHMREPIYHKIIEFFGL